MSSFAQAAEDIKRLAVRLRPILEIAEVLEGIASIEQAASEADRRKEDATRDEATAIEAKGQAEASLEVEKGKVQAVIDDCAAKVSKAESDASSIIDKANQDSAVIAQGTERLRGEANKALEDSNKRVQDMDSQVTAAQKILEVTKNKIEDAKRIARELLS